MRRRPLLALPYADDVPALAGLVAGTAVGAPADPGRFVEAALHHQVGGFAAVAAREGRLVLPREEQDRLASAVALRAVRTRLLCRELPAVAARVAAACEAPAVVLKGPGPLTRLYGADPRLRPFADLDLLVPAARLAAAVDALAGAGFRELVEFAPGFGERHGHDRHVRRGDGAGRVDVELHWRVGDDPLGAGLSHARLSAGAQPLEAAAGHALAPAPRGELVVLAVHLLSDRAKRLIWVVDVDRAARAAGEDDWRGAFALADELGLGWALDRALDYAAGHVGLDRPRPRGPAAAPAWGPLRAVEELDMGASLHAGRLAALPWSERPGYLRTILVPSRAALEDTLGGDEAPAWRLAARHARTALASLRPRR